MTVTVRCSDFNTDCPAQFTTPTEDELLEHAELHTRNAHPDVPWSAELAEVVKTRMAPA